MAEILLRVVDKTNPDKGLDALCTKRGDVISVYPDGVNWGRKQVNNPSYRIIKMPGVPVEALLDLVEPEYAVDGNGDRILVRKRAKQLAIDKLEVALLTKLSEEKVGEQKSVLQLNAAEATALIEKRETKVIDGKVEIG